MLVFPLPLLEQPFEKNAKQVRLSYPRLNHTIVRRLS